MITIEEGKEVFKASKKKRRRGIYAGNRQEFVSQKTKKAIRLRKKPVRKASNEKYNILLVFIRLNGFVINRSLIKWGRKEYSRQSATKAYSDFLSRNIEFVMVYWDSKILPDLYGTEIVDRLCITATSHGSEQLLAITQASVIQLLTTKVD